MRSRLVLLLILLWPLVGCTMNREFDGETLTAAQLQRLTLAKTKAEVLETVGPPADIGLQLDGSVFIYRYRSEEVDNLNLSAFRLTFDYETSDRRTARLTVFFDKKGNVKGFGLDDALRPAQDD